MNAEELKRLIEKYYNGDSTEEEELTLREYFIENNIPEGYEAEKDIFGYYKSAGKIPEPSDGFEARIMERIDSENHKVRTQKNRKYILPYISAAAGLLILVGSYFFLIQKSESEDTFTDPAIAYAETIKILKDISSQLNQGAHALQPVSKINKMKTKSFEAINKSSLLIEKNLKNLNYLQKAIEITNVPVNKN